MLDALVVLGWLQTSSLDALRNVVLGLLGLEDTRTRQLTRIESKVDALIDSPYRSARDYLDSARRVGVDTDKGKAYLEHSIHDFRQAAANYQSRNPRRESWACLHLLLLYTALGDIREAQEWGARGYEATTQWEQMEIAAFKNRQQLRRGRWSLFNLTYLLLFILIILAWIEGGHIKIGYAKVALTTISLTFLLSFFVLLPYGHGIYRALVSRRNKSQMKECDSFLNQMWRIWSSLSPNPAAVEFYKVCRVRDPESTGMGAAKTYELRSVDPPGHTAPAGDES